MEAGTTVQIRMPEMGESVTEGTILDWLKQVGDTVEAEEGIVEVSTDKVDTEIPAPASGVLTKILVQPDETVPIGTVLGEISPSGSAPVGGNGGAPDVAAPEPAATENGAGRDPDWAADESAVEEAEHGAAAEEEYEAAKESTDDLPPQLGASAAQLVDVEIPEMGESVSEGTILDWLVKVGDTVEKDQGLVEVSTDKVDAELPSPVAGVVAEILASPDDVVSIGTVVARISLGAAQPAAPTPEPGDGGGEILEVRVPEMGESVSEGTILDWLVEGGDRGEEDQGLVEVSTDKVDAELPSPAAGVITEILAKPDDVVSTGSVVARIAVGVAGRGSRVAGGGGSAEEEAREADVGQEPTSAPAGNGAQNATPVAARMAAANGVDVSNLKGTGPRGRVTKDDVENAIAGNGASAEPAAPPAVRGPRPAVPEGTTPIRGPAATLVRFMNE